MFQCFVITLIYLFIFNTLCGKYVATYLYENELVKQNELVSYHNHRHLRSSNSPKVRFVPYPHKSLFDGCLFEGIWIAGDISRMKPYLNQDFDDLDLIQRQAVEDGVYFPARGFKKFHLFSSDEAQQCLTGKRIFFIGDSYLTQMFIGLGEILLATPSNVEISDGRERLKILQHTEKELKKQMGSKSEMLQLYFNCHLLDFSCFRGQMLDDETWKNADALIASIAIHYKALHSTEKNMVDNYSKDLRDFMRIEDLHMSWVPGVAYHKSLNSTAVQITYKAWTVAKEEHVPFIDIFTMTDNCTWSNCSADGGHKSRFVNRMKAQMLLNNLCEFYE